jgi:hypothetical protein
MDNGYCLKPHGRLEKWKFRNKTVNFKMYKIKMMYVNENVYVLECNAV